MKNLIALGVLLVLGITAFLLFQEKPNVEQKKAEQAIKPLDAEKIDEVRIKRLEGIGDNKKEESYTIKKKDGKWRMTAPVDYQVVESSVETMTKSLSDLSVIDIISENPSAHDKFDVDDKKGIDMTALSGGQELLHILIGGSGNGVTYVRFPGKNEVYRMQGSFRFNFDRSTKSLRDKTIIKTEVEGVKTATFGQGPNALVLEKIGEGKELSVKPVGKEIKNFDAPKATGVLRTLVNLNALDFADGDLSEEILGFTGPEAFTVFVDAEEEGKPYQATLTLGNKFEDKAQVYVKSSLSDQVFIIAEYTANRLRAKAEDFVKAEEENKPKDK